LAGVVILVALNARKVRGSFIIVIIAATLVGIPLGLTHLEGSPVALPTIDGSLFMHVDLVKSLSPHYLPFLFAFFASEFFSTTGVIMTVTDYHGSHGEAGGRCDRSEATVPRRFVHDHRRLAVRSSIGDHLRGVDGGCRGRRAYRSVLTVGGRLLRSPAVRDASGGGDPLGRDGPGRHRGGSDHRRGLPSGSTPRISPSSSPR
jgi:AGZA family xanthine/uracil permease-like MFS transporter